MANVVFIVFCVIAGLVFILLDRNHTLSEVEKDLKRYAAQVQEVVRLSDDSATKTHYRAVNTALSEIIHKHFLK